MLYIAESPATVQCAPLGAGWRITCNDHLYCTGCTLARPRRWLPCCVPSLACVSRWPTMSSASGDLQQGICPHWPTESR